MQPLEGEGLLSANCEIYNWKELNEKYGWKTENDAETLLRILDKKGVGGLEELDGIYAFAYLRDGEMILARDKIGVNPVWYSENPFMFSSEKQAIEKQGLEARELHPRRVLHYDVKKQKISFDQREFFEVDAEDEMDIEEAAGKVMENFLEAVEKRVPEGDVGLLFSGGVDSTLIAGALQELGKDFTAYNAGIRHGNVNAPRDSEWAKKVAEEMGLELKRYEASLEEVKEELPRIADWISTTSVVKNGVALPFHFALRENSISESEDSRESSSSRNLNVLGSKGLRSSTEQVVFSGLGSEQLYAGYYRQQGYLNKECLSGLRSIFEKDLYRDNVISFRNGRELRLPFLDHDLINHALTIPERYKVKDGYRKYVLRKAAEKLVPEEVAWREKTAAQYGSNFDKAISRLAKNNSFSKKQKYLNSFREKPNRKLVALTSGGKDSNAALYRMQRRNNKISCMLTLRSENKHSYMFDSRKEKFEIHKQAEKLDTPLIVQETEGKKEEELRDLKKGILKAREEYGVEGVVAGALASTYQRDRVDRVAEEVGLKVFTPLWREDQKNYMRWLIREGFEIQITDVAARGLEKSWEGKILDEESVEELIELSKEYGFNAAGEGGEYETKVLGFPLKMI